MDKTDASGNEGVDSGGEWSATRLGPQGGGRRAPAAFAAAAISRAQFINDRDAPSEAVLVCRAAKALVRAPHWAVSGRLAGDLA